MFILAKRTANSALAGLILLTGMVSGARAQRNRMTASTVTRARTTPVATPTMRRARTTPVTTPTVTTQRNNRTLRNSLRLNRSLNLAAFDLALAARASSFLPPYFLGSNPYGTGLGYGLSPSSGGYSSPTYVNAYASPYASLYANPGTANGGSNTGSSSSSSSSPESEAANLINDEKVKQARLTTRRQLFDEILYERGQTMSFVRPEEIWSARALNLLLADLKRLHGKGVVGPIVDLEADSLRRINVRGESEPSNLGLLRSGSPLAWPAGFSNLAAQDRGTELCATIDAKVFEALRQARGGRVHPEVLNHLQASTKELHRLLAQNVGRLGANEYIHCKRFLNELDDALTVLAGPHAADHANRIYAARGQTVRALVENMARQGLAFAPATAGDEPAYQALYEALATYRRTCRPSGTRVGK